MTGMARASLIWLFCLTGCLAFGCSSRGRVQAPRLSPRSAAGKAMELYDTNHDDRLDATELGRCPALKNSLARFDKDGDGCLSADEIASRLSSYGKSKVGLIAVSCKV